MILAPWIILIGILSVLAAPVAFKEKTWRRIFIAMGLSFAGVVLPLFVFFFSSFMVPEWKGACHHGWLDCFIVGKLALAPLVLVATAALYSVEVLRVEKRFKRWIVVGIFLGATIAAVCFIFGLIMFAWAGWLWVPFYVAVWYAVRAGQLIGAARFNLWTYLGALLGSLPFWLVSWLWSQNTFASLPDQAPSGCFIVTAAGRGHRKLVGPFVEIERGGRRLHANQQLLTLWQFENFWRNRAPRSHQIFRRGYNRFGPFIAAQIESPWLADFAYLALKPVELAARLVTAAPNKSRTP